MQTSQSLRLGKRLGRWRLLLAGLLLLLLAGLASHWVWPIAVAGRGQNPLGQLQAESRSFRGVIVEALPAGSYRYLRLRSEDGQLTWVVTLGQSAALGATVEARSYGVRQDFASKRLHRRFAQLHFCLLRAL
jgi:hypothetical protein